MWVEVPLYNIDAGFGLLAEGVESINKKLLFRVILGALRKENCHDESYNNFRIVWLNQD